MAQLVRELMTSPPVAMSGDMMVQDAARRMRDDDIGSVLVMEDDEIRGILTDRDIVIRGLADNADLSNCSLREVCSSTQLITASPNEDADNAIARMREHAVRRIPVIDNSHPIGIFSIGDAAIDRDPSSALGDISAATANT